MDELFKPVFEYLNSKPAVVAKSKPQIDLDHTLDKLSQSSLKVNKTDKTIRDQVILLLRYRYKLKPAEIFEMNVDDVDIDNGLIYFAARKQNIPLLAGDIIYFRRWLRIREQYLVNGGDNAYLISFHWTVGRSKPFLRLGRRAIDKIIENSRKFSEGGW